MGQARSGDHDPLVTTWLRLPQPELGQAITLFRRTVREAGHDLTRDALAGLLCSVSDSGAAVDGTAVWRWETARVDPSPTYRRRLARVCEAELSRMGDASRREFLGHLGVLVGWPLLDLAAVGVQAAATSPPPLEVLAPTEQAGADYIDSIREAVMQLVSLDNRFGGNEIAGLATRTYRRAQAHLDAGLYRPEIERDLQAGASELAGLAGWLLHDAGDEAASRRFAQESLFLARLAGDRSMEQLTLANMSLQALFQRRPGEALQIARAQLASGHLSPRLEVVFGVRAARALAQMGDRDETLRALDRATATFHEGPSRLDPAWSWWVDESEFALHRGLAIADLGDREGALRLLQQAVELCPPRRRNARFIYLAQFLRGLIEVGAWSDVEGVVREARSLAGEVGSARTVGLLRSGLEDVASGAAPPSVREMARCSLG